MCKDACNKNLGRTATAASQWGKPGERPALLRYFVLPQQNLALVGLGERRMMRRSDDRLGGWRAIVRSNPLVWWSDTCRTQPLKPLGLRFCRPRLYIVRAWR